MTKIILFGIVTLSLIMQSCQKELSTENPTTIPTTLVDSNYLDKIYEIDITNGSHDTTGLWIYTYDNSKRVISMILKSTDPTDLSGVKYIYSYNNSDTLPNNTIFIETSFNSADTTTTFHFWDNNGKNIRDSSLHKSTTTNYYVVRKYSYGSGLLIGTQYSDLSGPGTSYIQQLDTAIINNAGDILNSKKYYFNTSTSNWEHTSITNFTYDTKNSPFAMLSNFRTFRIFPSGETFYYELPSYSNKLSQTETNSIETGSPHTNTFRFTNLYNTKNQLKEVKLYGTYSTSTPDSSKLIFTYKSL